MNLNLLKDYISRYQVFSNVFFIVWSTRLIWIGLYGVDVPYWDQWDAEAFELYLPILNGNFDFRQLIAQHNEHKIFFTRLLNILIFLINGHWNTVLVMQVQSILPSIIAGFLAHIVWQIHKSYSICLGIAIYFAAPIGTENMLWGFQSQFYFMILFSILSIYFFSLGESDSKCILFSFIFGVFAFLNIASGALVSLVVFIFSLFLLFFGLTKERRKIIFISLLFLLLFYTEIFFTDLPAAHKGLYAHDVYSIGKSLFVYLGWPVFRGIGLGYFIHAFAWGLFFYILIFKRARLNNPHIQLLINLQIWLYLQIFILIYARGTNDPNLPIANRYLDIIYLFPLFTFFLLAVLIKESSKAWLVHISFLFATIIVFCLVVVNGEVDRNILFLRREMMLSFLSTATRLEVQEKGSSLKYLSTKIPGSDMPYPDVNKLHQIMMDPQFIEMIPVLSLRDR